MTEGGQGGWEFEDVYEGLFKTAEDAILYIKQRGIIEGYSEQELNDFITRVMPTTTCVEKS